MSEIDGPRKKKNRLHVKNHEENRHDVKTHGVAAARVAFRRNSAFVRSEFRADGSRSRADQFENDNRYRGKRGGKKGEEKNGNVFARHRDDGIVPQPSSSQEKWQLSLDQMRIGAGTST